MVKLVRTEDKKLNRTKYCLTNEMVNVEYRLKTVIGNSIYTAQDLIDIPPRAHEILIRGYKIEPYELNWIPSETVMYFDTMKELITQIKMEYYNTIPLCRL